GGSTAGGAVTVRYSVSGTATPGSDYTALSGQVTVARGDSTAIRNLDCGTHVYTVVSTLQHVVFTLHSRPQDPAHPSHSASTIALANGYGLP
ncbi:MAG: hypothetical protein OXF01_12215, partial [Gemmatimonadetes bacterium]|nr:hypothetical protein [Gemmatimonadota bacterium]